MKKKDYQKPTMSAVNIAQTQMLCVSGDSYINETTSNVGITGGTQGSASAARVKGNTVDWDDWGE